MLNPATTQEQKPTTTPPGEAGGASAPSGSSAQPAGAAGGEEGSSQQPTTSAAPAETKPETPGSETLPDEPEPNVPWRKFREVQRDYTRLKRQHEGEYSKLQQQLQSVEQEKRQLQEVKGTYDVLEQLLEANPDIADMLYERAGKGTAATPRTGLPPSGTPSAPPAGTLPPEFQTLQKQMQEVLGFINGSRQSQEQLQQQEELRRTSEELNRQLTGMLTERRLDAEGWLPHVRAFVLDYVREHPETSLDEVKYLFTEWYRPMRGLMQKQFEAWRTGKQEDRGLPPAVAGSPTVQPRPDVGANDNKTASALTELLKQRMGWGDATA